MQVYEFGDIVVGWSSCFISNVFLDTFAWYLFSVSLHFLLYLCCVENGSMWLTNKPFDFDFDFVLEFEAHIGKEQGNFSRSDNRQHGTCLSWPLVIVSVSHSPSSNRGKFCG